MAGKIKLTAEEMRYIALFESITGATAKDCIIDDERNKLIFITKEKEGGLAVGKYGGKVKILKRMTGRDIEVIEYADNPVDFVRNAFMPVKVQEIRLTEKLDGRKIIVVKINEADKGLAIGRKGERANRIRQLAKKYFGIDNVIIV
ncbi:MAG: NusA-like transcription termination signal-binding factor [Candidatus Hecatellaceae archaeon]